jgi:FkbM family methyltransferase
LEDVVEQLLSGYWVPAGVYGKPFFDKLTKDGLPRHCEPHITAALEVLGPSRRTLAVDGGAYVGIWSVHLIQRFKTVVAFEPIADNAECYKRNLKMRAPLEHTWRLEEAALSSQATHDAVMLDIGKPYGFRFGLDSDKQDTDKQVSVKTTTIDAQKLPALDLLKLDVEGHELEALEGSVETIMKYRPVVIIEEKLDPAKRATRLLRRLGMRSIWQQKHDYLFVW